MAQQVAQHYNKALPITASDTVSNPQFYNRYPDAIYVGTAGKVVCVFGNAETAEFDAPQGVLPISGVVRVNNTTTTATELIALWQA